MIILTVDKTNHTTTIFIGSLKLTPISPRRPQVNKRNMRRKSSKSIRKFTFIIQSALQCVAYPLRISKIKIKLWSHFASLLNVCSSTQEATRFLWASLYAIIHKAMRCGSLIGVFYCGARQRINIEYSLEPHSMQNMSNHIYNNLAINYKTELW